MRPKREEIVAAAAAAIALAVLSGVIALIPSLDSALEIAVTVTLAALVLGPAAWLLLREASRLLTRREFGDELTGYTIDQQTGILRKGEIANVSLRVETVRTLLSELVSAIPNDRAAPALVAAGRTTGTAWASEFRRTLWTTGLRRDEILRAIYLWEIYDATAGMGRLSVAVDPGSGDGSVALVNSFLADEKSTTPLNHWFAGYIEGTLSVLLDRDLSVELVGGAERESGFAQFVVKGQGNRSDGPTPDNIHPQRGGRGRTIGRTIARLRRARPFG